MEITGLDIHEALQTKGGYTGRENLEPLALVLLEKVPEKLATWLDQPATLLNIFLARMAFHQLWLDEDFSPTAVLGLFTRSASSSEELAAAVAEEIQKLLRMERYISANLAQWLKFSDFTEQDAYLSLGVSEERWLFCARGTISVGELLLMEPTAIVFQRDVY